MPEEENQTIGTVEAFFEDYIEGEHTPKIIPMPRFVTYGVRYDLDFPMEGIIELTHIVLNKVVTDTDNVYVGAYYNAEPEVSTRENICFLSERPLGPAGEHYNVACTIMDGLAKPHECGPGMGELEVIGPKPKALEKLQLYQFAKNDDNTYTPISEIISINDEEGCFNPITNSEVTVNSSAPDGKRHCIIYANVEKDMNVLLGTQYRFIESQQAL